MKQILLLEPNYKNKYPPIGLMKISTYHKLLGDEIRFYKGDLNDLLYEERVHNIIRYLKKYVKKENWNFEKQSLFKAFKQKNNNFFNEIIENLPKNIKKKVALYLLKQFEDRKQISKYDRIYITTLFTFYWNVTIKTINFAKRLVDDPKQIYVGGIMASLLNGDIERVTGIRPYYGLLDKPGILGDKNDYIIDELPLDYSILHEIDYKYPTGNSFITFMTKGCTRNCPFCSVPQLEPIYKEIIPTKEKFERNKSVYGEQKNLLLMDNNVLASSKFSDIIREIKEMGFYRGAKYSPFNEYEIVIKNLKSQLNDSAYKRRFLELINDLKTKTKGKDTNDILRLVKQYRLNEIDNITKTNIMRSYKSLSPIFEKYNKKGESSRYVDFNQGIDARYLNEENIKLLSELNLKPLRIAFDYIGISDKYIKAVKLAAQNNIKYLSNYILYNFADYPIDLYKRLKINVDLNKELNLQIFSFPMRYIPIYGEEAKRRTYVGKYWNKKFLRAIQCILNATKGIVAPGYDFFTTAFGNDEKEYIEILYMPETFIIYREKFRKSGLTDEWRKEFNSLNEKELLEAKQLIEKNNFKNMTSLSNNLRIIKVLSYYTITNKDLDGVDFELKKLKKEFKRLINENVFLNLTLTHDFEVNSVTS